MTKQTASQTPHKVINKIFLTRADKSSGTHTHTALTAILQINLG